MDVVLTFSPPPRFCDTFEFYVSPWVKEETTGEDDENTYTYIHIYTYIQISRDGVRISSVIIRIVRIVVVERKKRVISCLTARARFFFSFPARVVGKKEKKTGERGFKSIFAR